MVYKLTDGRLSCTRDIYTNEEEKNRGQYMRERVKRKIDGWSEEDGKGPIRAVTAERVRF